MLGTLIAVAGCAEPGDGTRELLEALPEASLTYPAAELLMDGGRDAEATIDGPMPAVAWRIFGSHAQPQEIHEFFESELTSTGWSEVTGIRTTTELDAWRWEKDGNTFRLGIMDPDQWHARLEGSEAFPTIFDVRLASPQ